MQDSEGGEPPTYVLKLYIAGTAPSSVRAVVNLRELLETHLNGHYMLEVIDLASDVAAAKNEQIVAAPTLVKLLPLPLRRFIGDMSKTERILVGLDLQ